VELSQGTWVVLSGIALDMTNQSSRCKVPCILLVSRGRGNSASIGQFLQPKGAEFGIRVPAEDGIRDDEDGITHLADIVSKLSL
jgi:hypothetical protein